MPAMPVKPPIVNPAVNPYADFVQSPGMGVWQPDRVRALAKVQVPGVVLQIYGALLCLAGIGLAIAIPFVIMNVRGEDQVPLVVMCGLGASFGLVFGGIFVWGGTRMKSLKSYGWAMTAVVLTFVFGFLTCLPAVLIGIWPLVALLDPDVRASFERRDV